MQRRRGLESGVMVDEFERQLDRMFADAPVFPDAVLFAAEVDARLQRSQAVRRSVMGLAGGAGAAVGVAQLMASNFGMRLGDASAAAIRGIEGGLALLGQDASRLAAGGAAPPEITWLVVGLATLAIAFTATRFADRF